MSFIWLFQYPHSTSPTLGRTEPPKRKIFSGKFYPDRNTTAEQNAHDDYSANTFHELESTPDAPFHN